jgi:hypothetical protein
LSVVDMSAQALSEYNGLSDFEKEVRDWLYAICHLRY